jgi:pyoverdine/dityrosine biosynthesis protein Dit1
MAEELSLRFLNNVCNKIREVYPRGARIIICSDGRVFGDIVGVQDSDITRYRAGLREVIAQHAYTSIQLFGLDDEYPGLGHWATRSRLMNRYGESIEQLRRRVRREDDLTILYRGLSRILLEDADRSGEPGSGVAPDLNSERRAYGVMQRSRAWGRLIAERFPHAVRLSIHPQPCGSRKLGIRLLDAADNWITPWHGVAVDVAGRFVLMKRREAENLHARLVYANGRASHYVLTDTRVPGDERSPRVA